MVIDIPGGLFGQRDVRETNTTTPSGTSYLNIHGTGFIPRNPDIDDSSYGTDGVAVATTTFDFQANLILPHGATITGVIVYGADSADTWTMSHVNSAGSATTMASGTFGTEDTSITNPIIDNQQFSYMLQTGNVAVADDINGARVTYTI